MFVQDKRPWLMKLSPSWLREKLFWKLYALKSEKNVCHELFSEAYLEFAPKVALELLPTDTSHQQIAYTGFYELCISKHVFELAKLGGLMIDVGANYGYYSCLWASNNINNIAIAFEASPKNINPLRKNINNNNLHKQIHIHTIAVGKEAGILPFTLGPNEQTGWGGLSLEKTLDAVQVQVDTLDNLFFDSAMNIKVLKIDTEGADTWVLQGAEKLLINKRIQHIFFEQQINRMSVLSIQPDEAKNFLVNLGYLIHDLGANKYYATIK